MADLSKYPIFESNKATLKDTSADDHDGGIAYMTESLCEVVNFDLVKSEYVRGLKLIKIPKSNDALFLGEDGRWTFIEFKNGCMQKKIYNVRQKIFDSMLIFSDIVGCGISYTRKEMDYILVYNEERNPEDNDVKSYIGESSSRDKIAKTLMAKGNQSYIKYGLETFKNYCFKEVFTYTEQEFHDNFVDKIAQ